MSSPERPAGAPGPVRRRIAAALAVVAVVVPVAGLFAQFEANRSDNVAFAEAERVGVVYLRALNELVAATADAQSAAVAGGPADGARLAETRSEVDAVDARLGAALGVNRRWADVSVALDEVVAGGATGGTAYDEWSRVVDLELALVAAVYDASNLVLDPELDAYYVSAAVASTLPRVVVTAGRIADLTVLSGGKDHEDPGLTEEESAAAGGAEELRARFGDEVGVMDRGLRVAFGSTGSTTLGPALLGRLDRLRDAATALSPSAQVFGAEAEIGSVSAVLDERAQVRDAAVSLAGSAATELDGLLADRLADLAGQLRLVLGLLAGGAALLAVAGWLVLGGTPRPAHATEPGDAGSGEGPDHVDDLRVDAEELLDARRLVRSGRALSTVRDER